jgi:hypothetical protein
MHLEYLSNYFSNIGLITIRFSLLLNPPNSLRTHPRVKQGKMYLYQRLPIHNCKKIRKISKLPFSFSSVTLILSANICVVPAKLFLVSEI